MTTRFTSAAVIGESVYLGGYVTLGSRKDSAAVVRSLSGDGKLRWEVRLDEEGKDEVSSIGVAATTSIAILQNVVHTTQPFARRVLVHILGDSGAKEADFEIHSDLGDDGRGLVLVDGDPVALVATTAGVSGRGALIRFDPKGTIKWVVRLDMVPMAVTYDADGPLVVVVGYRPSAACGTAFIVTAYDPFGGQLRWSRGLDSCGLVVPTDVVMLNREILVAGVLNGTVKISAGEEIATSSAGAQGMLVALSLTGDVIAGSLVRADRAVFDAKVAALDNVAWVAVSTRPAGLLRSWTHARKEFYLERCRLERNRIRCDVAASGGGYVAHVAVLTGVRCVGLVGPLSVTRPSTTSVVCPREPVEERRAHSRP